MWYLQNIHIPGERISKAFESRGEAQAQLDKLGPIISDHYRIIAETGNAKVDRMLTEGLRQGDMERILLPRISIDEYVPSDPDTDNIVLAFFIKGVPEATRPFQNYIEHSNGVLSADNGLSQTITDATIVYAEFDRENLDVGDIEGLIIGAAMIGGIEAEDFTMTFPHSNDKFPYDIQEILAYFEERNRKKNQQAQQKAFDEVEKEFEKALAQNREQQQQEQADESIEDALVAIPLTG